MTDIDWTMQQEQRKLIGCTMRAIAQTLTGTDRFDEFREKVEIMTVGRAPSVGDLKHFAPQVRKTGRPVIWIYHDPRSPGIPRIGLVAQIGRQRHVVVSCTLWLGDGQDRAMLMPDGVDLGAYRFDDDLVLRHDLAFTLGSGQVADKGIQEAYGTMAELAIAYMDHDDAQDLPDLVRAG